MTKDEIAKLETPWTDEMEIEIQGDHVVYADEVRSLEQSLVAAVKVVEKFENRVRVMCDYCGGRQHICDNTPECQCCEARETLAAIGGSD